MSIIMLMMVRESIVESLTAKLQNSPNVSVIHDPDYDNAKLTIGRHNPNVAVIEVTETDRHNVSYCLALCQQLRQLVPKCKLLVMCPEQDENGVKQVVDAKLTKKIDDFVFYDVTVDYLTSKILSL